MIGFTTFSNIYGQLQSIIPRISHSPFSKQNLILSSAMQKMYFSKYISKARAKRQPLTTKRAGKGYYKGNRCRKEGYLDSRGLLIYFMS